MSETKMTRRGAMKVISGLLGLGVAAISGVPFLRFLLFPVGVKTVDSGKGFVDIAASTMVSRNAKPVYTEIIVPRVRDAWNTKTNVLLGGTWLVRNNRGALSAFSSVCPHLGCSIQRNKESVNDSVTFFCPCHSSAFSRNGERLSGPSPRGLDLLPVIEKNGRILVQWSNTVSSVNENDQAS